MIGPRPLQTRQGQNFYEVGRLRRTGRDGPRQDPRGNGTRTQPPTGTRRPGVAGVTGRPSTTRITRSPRRGRRRRPVRQRPARGPVAGGVCASDTGTDLRGGVKTQTKRELVSPPLCTLDKTSGYFLFLSWWIPHSFFRTWTCMYVCVERKADEFPEKYIWV